MPTYLILKLGRYPPEKIQSSHLNNLLIWARLPAAVQENEPALILQKERLEEYDFLYGFQPIRLHRYRLQSFVWQRFSHNFIISE